MYDLFNQPKTISIEDLPAPKSQLQETLHYLIVKREFTTKEIIDDCWVLRCSEYIRQLRHDHHLAILTIDLPHTNRHGRKIHYGKYKLLPESFDLALEVYDKMSKGIIKEKRIGDHT